MLVISKPSQRSSLRELFWKSFYIKNGQQYVPESQIWSNRMSKTFNFGALKYQALALYPTTIQSWTTYGFVWERSCPEMDSLHQLQSKPKPFWHFLRCGNCKRFGNILKTQWITKTFKKDFAIGQACCCVEAVDSLNLGQFRWPFLTTDHSRWWDPTTETVFKQLSVLKNSNRLPACGVEMRHPKVPKTGPKLNGSIVVRSTEAARDDMPKSNISRIKKGCTAWFQLIWYNNPWVSSLSLLVHVSWNEAGETLLSFLILGHP